MKPVPSSKSNIEAPAGMQESMLRHGIANQLVAPQNAPIDAKFESSSFSLCFKDPLHESRFMQNTAHSRLPVLIAIAAFDFFMNVFRLGSNLVWLQQATPSVALTKFFLHSMMLIIFYGVVGALHFYSRKTSQGAAREEILLSGLLSLAISSLVASSVHSTDDWIYAAYFLICTTAILKFRWFVGATALTVPLAVAVARQQNYGPFQDTTLAPFPPQVTLNLIIAWLVGGLMGFLADSNRRQAYANHLYAVSSTSKEVEEVNARITAERGLAAAHAEARAKEMLADKERAALEARHSFVSMLCHEVRTPLGGCLAAAELLMETPLNDDQRELAKTVRVSGSILMSTVSSFLDLFKLEAGKQLDVVQMPLALQGLTDNVQRIMDALLGDSIPVELLPPELSGAPSQVMGDPGRLCGVLLNLCTNAVKFTRRGRIQIRVREVLPGERPSVEDAEAFCSIKDDLNNNTNSMSLSLSRQGSSNRSEGSSDGDEQQSEHTQTSWASTTSSTGQNNNNNNASAGEASVGRASEHDSVNSVPMGDGGGGHNRHRRNKLPLSSSTSLNKDVRPPSASSSSSSSSLTPPMMVTIDEGNGWLGVYSQMRRRSLSNGNADFSPRAAATPELSEGLSSCPSSASIATSSTTSTSIEQQQQQQQQQQQKDQKWLLFEVMDTGHGVAPKSLRSLFRDYVQGDIAEQHKPRTSSGTGLGLSICSKQVAVMGGVIGALSKPESGSVFWFAVPCVPTADDDNNNIISTPLIAEDKKLTIRTATGDEPASDKEERGASKHENKSTKTLEDVPEGYIHHGHVSSDEPPTMHNALVQKWRADAHFDDDDDEDNNNNNIGDEQPNQVASSIKPTGAPTGNTTSSNAALLQKQVQQQQQQPPLQSVGIRPGLRVLLVEDNMINVRVAERVLRSLGAVCEVAHDGRQAVDAVQSAVQAGTPYEVVIMDMIMPVMNGLEASLEIRKLGHTLPIIALTANTCEEQECNDAGMTAFLSKPVLRDQLAATLRKCCPMP